MLMPVIVTAERVAGHLQDISMTITALNTQQLLRNSVTNLSDIHQSTAVLDSRDEFSYRFETGCWYVVPMSRLGENDYAYDK